MLSDNPEEAEYYLRLIVMYIDLATDTARRVFYNMTPSQNVDTFFASVDVKNKLESMLKRNILSKKEYELVTRAHVRPEEFDISLLVTLLSHLYPSKLKAPKNGWKLPVDPGDFSIAADLLRLRDIRNKTVAHQSRARMAETKFITIWDDVEKILVRLIQQVDSSFETTLKGKINDYRMMHLDSQDEKYRKYLDMVQEWFDGIMKLQEQVEETLRKMDENYGNVINGNDATDIFSSVERKSEEIDIPPNADNSTENNQTLNLKAIEDSFEEKERIKVEQDLFTNIDEGKLHKNVHQHSSKLDESHKEIQTLRWEPAVKINISSANPDSTSTYEIRGLTLPHEQWSSLSLSLSRNIDIDILILDNVNCTKTVCEGHFIDLSKHEKLQSLSIDRCSSLFLYDINPELESCKIRNSDFSHKGMVSFSSCISRASNLKELQLDSVKCPKTVCESHSISLSKHEKLQSLVIDGSCNWSVYDLNPCLESCKIRYVEFSHDGLQSLSLCISRAVNLKELILECVTCSETGCDGHSIDLRKHEKLLSLRIDGSGNLSLNNLNPNLESCKIRYAEFSHDGLLSLSSCLSRALKLRELNLECVTCSKIDCEGHFVDLSKDETLQSLTIDGSYSLSLYDINPQLKSCGIRNVEFSHEEMISLSSCIAHGVNLTELNLEFVTCSNTSCDGHSFNLSKHEKLQSLTIDGSGNLSLNALNPQLESCQIYNVEFSHNGMSSLSSCISRAVKLKELHLECVTCSNTGCEGHPIDLSKHEKFQSLTIDGSGSLYLYDLNSQLRSCAIRNVEISHERMLSLSSCISRAVSLNKLHLECVTCSVTGCEGHFIDLSKYEKLHNLTIHSGSLSIHDINPHLEVCKILHSKLSHEAMISLSLCISRATVALKNLQLVSVNCSKIRCEGHSIDLSKHDKLQSITIHSCDCFSLQALNPKLEFCKIKFSKLSHERIISLLSCISCTVNLKNLQMYSMKCSKTRCEGHSIDLSKHEKLQSLTLNVNDSLSLYDLNSKLESCTVLGTKLSHEGLLSLLSCISRAVNLKELIVKGIPCSTIGCDSHSIDLSKHEKLRSLTIDNCGSLSIYDLNPKLKACYIRYSLLSHNGMESLASCISRVLNLEKLELVFVKCSKIECEGHFIDLSKHCQLQIPTLNHCQPLCVTRTHTLNEQRFPDNGSGHTSPPAVSYKGQLLEPSTLYGKLKDKVKKQIKMLIQVINRGYINRHYVQ